MASLNKLTFVLVSLGLFFLLLPISAQAQTPNACDADASFGRSDKILFGKYCGACHTVTGRWKRLVRTPLGGLFGREQLSTGEPVNEETVRGIIENGRPVYMPGFKYTLTPRQVTEIIQFLKSARCSEF